MEEIDALPVDDDTVQETEPEMDSPATDPVTSTFAPTDFPESDTTGVSATVVVVCAGATFTAKYTLLLA